jgi:hypothetical protein
VQFSRRNLLRGSPGDRFLQLSSPEGISIFKRFKGGHAKSGSVHRRSGRPLHEQVWRRDRLENTSVGKEFIKEKHLRRPLRDK